MIEPLPIASEVSGAAARSESGVVKGRYALVSLGCPKNLVDSERILGRLRLDGYQLVNDPAEADFVVVNTCGFIESARRESESVIAEMARLKESGRIGGLIVAGCLAERARETLFKAYPAIDAITGVFSRDEVAAVADRLIGHQREQQAVFRPAPVDGLDDRLRFRVTPRHFTYLKISEGCDRLCTFCSIPQMRGKHISKPIEQVVGEAEVLAADGAEELIVVAQDTTYYGIDRYGRPRLRDLLAALEKVEGVRWIRLMYLYPMHFDEGLIEFLASSRKVVPYLDIPLQHIDDDVLRRMARRVDRASTEALLARLREAIDGLVLRTTMLVGFPGETEAQFERLVRFVESARFERLGVFAYSFEPTTPSARLDGHLPPEVREARRARLMEVQQGIAFAWAASQVGRTWEVVLDRPLPDQEGVWVGRTYADAPQVDPVVYVTAQEEPLAAGRWIRCEIVAAQGYDLVGVPV